MIRIDEVVDVNVDVDVDVYACAVRYPHFCPNKKAAHKGRLSVTTLGSI